MLIRGINKRIIEVNDTGSDMFEKVLFFVNVNCDYSDKNLEKEAKRIIGEYFIDENNQNIGYLRYTENKNKKIKYLLMFIGVISIISLISFTLFLIL